MKITIKLHQYTEELKPIAYAGGSFHCYTSRPRIWYATIYTAKDRKQDIKDLLRDNRAQAHESAARKHARQDAKRSYLQPHLK